MPTRSADSWSLPILFLFFLSICGAKRVKFPPYKWSIDDAKAFIDAITPTGIDAREVAKVYQCESGLNPHATNGFAFGLCQATKQTLRGIGWKNGMDDFVNLTVRDQAAWCAEVIRAQIKAIGYVPRDAGELYVANLSPAAARSRSSVIYRAPSKEYDGNKGLDVGKKGYITPDDMRAAIRRHSKDSSLLTVFKLFDELGH
jgi:hypothetical protein